MIASQELRLGNYMMCGSLLTQVTTINIKNFIVTELDISEGEFNYKSDQSKINPIELTEEWLLKFGFKRRYDQKYYHEKYDRTWVEIKSILVKWYGNAGGEIKMFDYVHELQNIFQIMTGEELTIKE